MINIIFVGRILLKCVVNNWAGKICVDLTCLKEDQLFSSSVHRNMSLKYH
jgi:hypothetical protein